MNDGFADCLAELEQRSLLPGSALAVFGVGSVARGWANPQSDFDVNIVSVQPWPTAAGKGLRVPLDPPSVPTEIFPAGGRRCETKYWLDSQVDQLLAKVSWEQFNAGQVAGELLIDTEELFLERLVTCVPLTGADWVRRRRDELDASAFRAFVVTRSLAEADGCVEDAMGQLTAGDTHSAVISARKAFGHAVDALLESVGEYGSQTPKWRARRFRAAAPAALGFDDYWAVETMRTFDPDHPAKWVEMVARMCKEISIDADVPEEY